MKYPTYCFALLCLMGGCESDTSSSVGGEAPDVVLKAPSVEEQLIALAKNKDGSPVMMITCNREVQRYGDCLPENVIQVPLESMLREDIAMHKELGTFDAWSKEQISRMEKLRE